MAKQQPAKKQTGSAPGKTKVATPTSAGNGKGQSSGKAKSSGKSRSTATSSFGVSRREGHDASGFYERFEPPIISDSAVVNDSPVKDEIILNDIRAFDGVAPNSVALVVTSPPYFAGKAYEEELGEGHIPASYLDYLAMLEGVFAKCVELLEDGGRIAVNVANLGRRPYRSLSADVIDILQNRLHLLLRGEVIWRKAQGASGSCAWGSFQSPVNPVMRDLTERVIIASKGRFDRAVPRKDRQAKGMPSNISLFKEEFMDGTTDVWDIAPESATRVNHPAPFPVELPERLIHLFTFEGDLVLDPFMGSGTTGVAAVRTGRHYLGFDVDADYVAAAEKRIELEAKALANAEPDALRMPRLSYGISSPDEDEPRDLIERAIDRGAAARDLAEQLLSTAGFTDIKRNYKGAGGVDVAFRALDAKGNPWLIDVSGAFTTTKQGLRRTDTVLKAVGKAALLRSVEPKVNIALLSTDMPVKGSPGAKALQAAQKQGNKVAPALVQAVLDLQSKDDFVTLQSLARG